MQKNTETIVVTGYDLFYYETSKKQAREIAKAVNGTMRKFGQAAWCITHMLEEDLHVEKKDLVAAVMATTLMATQIPPLMATSNSPT
ncbi:hypothetical protein, partial [Limnohabitans sp.]|uniref:hypothetical protein n=1 Tax=Limnohabitans sp. TaxID=1907725 RepID=UPI0031FD2092